MRCSWILGAGNTRRSPICLGTSAGVRHPDRRDEDEARIVGEVGRWIGTEVFGPVAATLARERPAAVRVIVPDAARGLLFRPLELAYANGVPLALRDVTLVMQPAGDDGVGVTTSTRVTGAVTAAGSGDAASTVPTDGRLRILGLFSCQKAGSR
jgi:hypothetical protein